MAIPPFDYDSYYCSLCETPVPLEEARLYHADLTMVAHDSCCRELQSATDQLYGAIVNLFSVEESRVDAQVTAYKAMRPLFRGTTIKAYSAEHTMEALVKIIHEVAIPAAAAFRPRKLPWSKRDGHLEERLREAAAESVDRPSPAA